MMQYVCRIANEEAEAQRGKVTGLRFLAIVGGVGSEPTSL